MLKYHIKTAYRNIIRKRFFSLTNILGIALGFSAFFYIQQYVTHENSFDSHIPDRERIARITVEKYRNGELIVSGAESYVASGPVLQEEIPEIESYTRTFNTNLRLNAVTTYVHQNEEKIALKLKDYYYADSSFLTFFGYSLLKGDPKNALNEPNTAVITESLAKIYFGDDDPMGKILIYEDEELTRDEHRITGVMADPPTNTHLPFRLLLSYNTFNSRANPYIYKNSWRTRKAYSYVKLHPSADFNIVEGKLPDLVTKHMNLPDDRKEILKLQPLSEIHFTESLADEPVQTTRRKILEILYLVAFLILGVAIINYINLSTSVLMARSGEVGVRKILGAQKMGLITQFFIECSLIVVAAFLLSGLLLIILWDFLNGLSGTVMPFSLLWAPQSLQLIGTVLISCILLAGIAPAISFATINPVNALKGVAPKSHASWIRLGLVVGQFTISFCLIAATLIVYSQLNFMQDQELGINIEQKVVVRTPGIMPGQENDENEAAFRQFLLKVQEHSSINNHTASLTIPGHLVPFRTGGQLQSNPDHPITVRVNGVNDNFFETYDLTFLAGRSFSETDLGKTIILTETATEKLGFEKPENAIGSIVQLPAFRMSCEVIGVVNDYRLESVKSELEPMVFVYNSLINTNFFSFKINNNAEVPLEHINQSWANVFPGNPMDYFFLEDYFNEQYKQEKRLSQLFGAFGFLTIFLAGMGLFGLSTYIVKKLSKEIGIRKILGSTVQQIFFHISSRFLKLVIVSSIIGIPLMVFLGDKWLEQFPIRVEINFLLYLLPAILLIFIAFLSTSYQTIKASLINPTQVLKDL